MSDSAPPRVLGLQRRILLDLRLRVQAGRTGQPRSIVIRWMRATDLGPGRPREAVDDPDGRDDPGHGPLTREDRIADGPETVSQSI